MTTLFLAFLVSFLAAVALTRLMIPLAHIVGLVDQPGDFRKIHTTRIPAMGGPAILAAFIAPICMLFLLPEWSTVSELLIERRSELTGLVIGALLTVILGLVDDKYGIKPRWKLLVQVGIAVVIYYCGLKIDQISNPLPGGEGLSLGIFALPVTVLWVVACMNAVNLLDGIDGLAAGVALFVALTVLLVSLQYRNILGAILMASMSGATMGFLVFNFPPARIFLGDSGSLLLGFLVASLSLAGTARKAEAAVALFIPLVALGLPILDTSMAILRRWYKRLPIDAPDRMHIHHVLVGMGYSQKRVILTLYSICLVLGGAALLISFSRSEVVLLVIGSLTIMAFVTIRVFGGVKFSDVMKKLAADRIRNDQLKAFRHVVQQVSYDMKQASGIDELWSMCCRAFVDLDLVSAELIPKDGSDSGMKRLSWISEQVAEQGADAWLVQLALSDGDKPEGVLILGKVLSENSVCLPPEIVGALKEFADIFSVELFKRIRNRQSAGE